MQSEESIGTVTLTESAAAKVRELLARDGELDHESHQFGVRVIVDPGSAEHVAGTTVDDTDELNRAGFQIQNPSATATCGCGESFSV